jgi:hypothetical protein
MKQTEFRLSDLPHCSRRREEADAQRNIPRFASLPRRLRAGAIAATLTMSLLGVTFAIPAAELATVPMQGSMLMPTVWYHEATDSVTVGLDDIIVTAQLTPLLVSHPNDWFKTEDPWFESLDPSRQGLAFSRRYGFVMHAMTDYLPLDRELWIRKISSSPALSFYDYNDFVSPKTWHPVFGTEGTTNATYWSGLMWHIGVTAPPDTNTSLATFEIFVMNTTTGQPVPNSSSGPFLLAWTCVPDGRPGLTISNAAPGQVRLQWPASASNWSLLSGSSLHNQYWQAVTNTPTVFGDKLHMTLAATNLNQFYRLQLNR